MLKMHKIKERTLRFVQAFCFALISKNINKAYNVQKGMPKTIMIIIHKIGGNVNSFFT